MLYGRLKVGVTSTSFIHVDTRMRNLTPTVCVAEAPNPALSSAECCCVDSDVGNMWVAARGSIYTVGPDKQVSGYSPSISVCVYFGSSGTLIVIN